MQSDKLSDFAAPDGEYELVRGLGQPGTEVFLARSKDGRDLVLRIWRSESEPDTRSAIEVATAACSVRHPMIASMFQAGEDSDRTLRLVSEYVPGRTLAEWISMAGLPPLTMAIDFVKRLAFMFPQFNVNESP